MDCKLGMLTSQCGTVFIAIFIIKVVFDTSIWWYIHIYGTNNYSVWSHPHHSLEKGFSPPQALLWTWLRFLRIIGLIADILVICPLASDFYFKIPTIEKNYVKLLNYLIDEYQAPLERNKLISKTEVKQVFGNLIEILPLHKALEADMATVIQASQLTRKSRILSYSLYLELG